MSGPPQQQPPHARIKRVAHGYMLSRIVYAVAELQVPDLLADGKLSIEDLAAKTGCHEPSLYRLLRGASAVGVTEELPDRYFQNTELSEAMQTDAPERARWSAVAMVGPWMWASFGAMMETLKTGETAMRVAFGKDLEDYLAEHPDQSHAFQMMMEGGHSEVLHALAEVLPVEDGAVVVDVGGGEGLFMDALLTQRDGLTGVVLDRPIVTPHTLSFIGSRRIADRCEVVDGNYLEAVPTGDAYVLAHIAHTHDDAALQRIITCCATANPNASVHVLQGVLPGTPQPAPTKLQDVVMMLTNGGKERTVEEFTALFETRGYALSEAQPVQHEMLLNFVPE